jgi:hypothetical protein
METVRARAVIFSLEEVAEYTPASDEEMVLLGKGAIG